MEYAVKLPVFEGPLDILLHLIKKHEIDIYDIPIALITEQYLSYLDMMRQLDLNIAAEFLLMTATLAYIKSRMLLPVMAGDEEDEDPRQLLVQQLLEYQKIKKSAQDLQELAQLRQQVFTRQHPPEEDSEVTAPILPGIGIYGLWKAFQHALANAPRETPYQVLTQRGLSLEEEITYILAKLEEHPRLSLQSLFKGFSRRLDLVLIFVALLELARRQLLRLYQSQPCGQVWISAAR